MIFRSQVSILARLCCAMTILATMSESALAMTPVAPQEAKLIFSISASSSESRAILYQTKAIMAERLHGANVYFTMDADGGRVFISVRREAESLAQKLLTAPGIISLRIYPRGDAYSPKSGRPIVHATLGEDEAGQPSITLRFSDPASFQRFTTRHIDQRLGIYLDGNEVAAPEITAPLSDSVQLTGNVRGLMSSMFVSIVNSGPLPVPVKFLGRQSER